MEVTLDDGTQVDVQLDESFAVVSSSTDHEDADESARAADPEPDRFRRADRGFRAVTSRAVLSRVLTWPVTGPCRSAAS